MNIPAQRRFDDLPTADPTAVRPLPTDHPAMREMRTLFPSTVVDVKDSPRLLVSGHNNRKIGKMVAKGEWSGMPIYTLTLEERATCPDHCHMLSTCYGNSMQWARRHRYGEEFEGQLMWEVAAMAREHPSGFVVRLHVLGDFYSPQYVDIWHRMLEAHRALRVFGYTARSVSQGSAESRDTAEAIHKLNATFPDRCVIRFSSANPIDGGATVISYWPETMQIPEGFVCPAETSDTACCSTCGLCWAPAMRNRTIVFVLHGKGSNAEVAEIKAISKKDDSGLRQIRAFNTGLRQWSPLKGKIIEIRQVRPTDLYIDESYQRALTRKSAKLIIKICQDFDWRKYNPPHVTEEADGRLHVIDGQHTAIAAASHPAIREIPVIVIDAETIRDRADVFIGINRDRIPVTPAQIFYAELTAGNAEAVAVKRMCDAADVIILRQQPGNGEYGPGETIAITTLRRLYQQCGETTGKQVLDILVEAGIAPITECEIAAVKSLLTDKQWSPRPAPQQIWMAVRSLGRSLRGKAYGMQAQTGEALNACFAKVVFDHIRTVADRARAST